MALGFVAMSQPPWVGIAGHDPRLVALLRVSNALALHRTIGELFRVLADQLHEVVPFDFLALIVHDEASDHLRLVVLEPGDIVPPFVSAPVSDHGPAATVWVTQKGAVIPIPGEGPLPPVLDFIRSQGRTVSCWLPLTTAHRRVGVLSFGSRHTTDYTDDVVDFMEQVAAAVAIAVDNSINFEEAQRYQKELGRERDRLELLLDVNNLLVSELDYSSLLKGISEALQRVIEHDDLSVALYDEDSGSLHVQLSYDERQGVVARDLALSLDRSAVGLTFQSGKARLFTPSDVEALRLDSTRVMKLTGLQSVCCVPLVTRRAKLGTLNVGSVSPDAFSPDDIVLLEQTSRQIAIAIENALAFRKMAQQNVELLGEKQYLEDEIQHEFKEIVGHGKALKTVQRALKTVAATDSSVLLLGETGTGKEALARAVHNLSPRRQQRFVRVSIPAVPPTLIESELFGYEKGAFTGATATRIGRLELANRGTLFLDEVGDIPLELQPKLLRVLQEREFERLGSTRTQKVDVRVVAATNRDLERMVEEGSFRSDLYYRFNVFPIHVPPLRDRLEDIPPLVHHFVQKVTRRIGRPVPTVSPATMRALQSWHWPGNIRELENLIERAIILSSGPELLVPLQDLQVKPSRTRAASVTFHDAEREAIIRALRESGGAISGPGGAAARLGLKRTTLHSKMRKLGIERPSY
jgi:formate hydrogenlyase transcriptional activator